MTMKDHFQGELFTSNFQHIQGQNDEKNVVKCEQKLTCEVSTRASEGKSGTITISNTNSTNNTNNIISNTNTNNTANITKVILGEKEKFTKILFLFGRLYKFTFGCDYRVTNEPKLRRILYPLLRKLSLRQSAALVFVHYDWRGILGRDEGTLLRLKENGFPFEWLVKNAQNYEIYIRNTLGVDFDDDVALGKLLKLWSSKTISGMDS